MKCGAQLHRGFKSPRLRVWPRSWTGAFCVPAEGAACRPGCPPRPRCGQVHPGIPPRWNDERMAASDTVDETPGSTQAWSPRLALLVAATFFMEFLDGTVLTPAIPNIADDFRVPAADVNITMTAYLLTVAMGIPLSGWLAERFGARRVFCLAIAIFTLASLACSLSQDLTALTLSR